MSVETKTLKNLKIISAGAGSGKTYRLMQEMVALLQAGVVQPEGIIATTFTQKAAAELEERVRIQLLEEGLPELADRLTGALIGTVHGLGVKLLKRFCFEAGVSPNVDIMADSDQSIFFNQSLSNILSADKVEKMETLMEQMSLRKTGYQSSDYDWRKDVKDVVDRARANGFEIDDLKRSKEKSFQSLAAFFPSSSSKSVEEWNEKLHQLLLETSEQLAHNEKDKTKVTQSAIIEYKKYINKIEKGDLLTWLDWTKIQKTKVAKKSHEIVAPLQDFTKNHDQHPLFLSSIKAYSDSIFDIAIEAIEEYENFKKKRGLIDYIDMETHVKKLLQFPEVVAVLTEEIDLLMVDEFQDTNPIQLEIFWKLSQMANHSIWVGDPKQSIYGFRGAEPELMQGIIDKNGGIKPQDIQAYSWRSREDIVDCTNAIFTQAFSNLPPERIALKAKRKTIANPDSSNQKNEPEGMETALKHWHFEHEGGGKRIPARPWAERCIARNIRQLLEDPPLADRKNDQYSPLLAKDIAILCRSNYECLIMAEALNHQGLKASIARNGLLGTKEAILVLACLKYILSANDSLSMAEIATLASEIPLEEIVTSRLDSKISTEEHLSFSNEWLKENIYIQKLDALRPEISELSGTEVLNLIVEELDLRRIVMTWGNPEQRCDNIDMIRQFAVRYEDACNRLHTGASLGGFLLWLYDLHANDMDTQSSSEQDDAINVLTYHRSKGLEWSFVVLSSLENSLKDNIWGANVVSESKEIDLNNISAHRYIRFWKHPYGQQYKSTNLQQKIDASEVKKQSIQKALEEDGRVLYVGITRARDYLVFTSKKKPMAWLNRVYAGLVNESQDILDPQSYETPWTWKGKALITETKTEILPVTLESYPIPQEKVQHLSQRAGQATFTSYFIDTDHEKNPFKIKVAHQEQFGFSFKEVEEISSYTIALMLQALISFDLPTYSPLQRLETANRTLQRHGIDDEISTIEILDHHGRFMDWVIKNISPSKWYKHYPVQLFYQERQLDTTLDVLLENDTEIHLIQHSSFLGKHKQWFSKAKEQATWFYYVQLALKEIFPDKKVRLWQHFIMSGGVQEIILKPQN